MLVVQPEVGIFSKQWLLISLETNISTSIKHRVEQVVLLVATTNQLISHAVVDVQEIVSVLTSILGHLGREGPGSHSKIVYK